MYSTIRNTKLEDLHRLLGWERRQSQIVLPCLSQNQLLSGWHLSAMPVGKWHALWASLRHMQSMQVHCPTHNEQCVISHNSKSTGTELTGWSHHVSHTYIAYRSSTPCTQQEVAAYNDGWSALRWHVTSIYTSRYYVAPVSIAADLLWYSRFQSFQSFQNFTKVSGATCCRCSVHVASHWSHWWEDRKHSHYLCGHALALISVANM